MNPTIKVCTGTYGDEKWAQLAKDRAWASVERQTVAPYAVDAIHAQTLAEARNGCVGDTDADWLCFLDADDELDEHYIENMMRVAAATKGLALIQPATLGVHPDGREDPRPVLIPPKPLLEGNFLIIGTLIRRDQFERLGGFNELPMYEDWELWIRAWFDGAELLICPEAIYRVHVNTNGRNSGQRADQVSAFNQIRSRYLHARRAS